MIISQLSSPHLVASLSGAGLFLSVGPFVFRIQTEIPQIVEGIRFLYSEFPVVNCTDFADFHVQLDTIRNWRNFGSRIRVDVDGDTPSSPLPIEQAYAVFEGCLNWCIYTQAFQYLIIHAAAIERNGQAVIMPAPPGSGKSTLCAALVSRGWRLLTDELVLIDTYSHMIIPLARPVSLKNESIDVINKFASGAVFGPTSVNTIKGTIAHMKPPSDSVLRMDEPCSVKWLIIPSYRPNGAASARVIDKGEAFMRVAESAVNYIVLGETGFDLVSSVIDQISAYRFEYSDLNEAVLWFEQLESSDQQIAISQDASG